jgi:uncharacterized protein YyaL (SSP411 family)
MTENRLARETSPYLRQLRNNPVDWYPWGREALGRARRENKPILLSVGYAACHWCHVMAHESFESTEIAARMNADFINIKVDREERPDLDSLYQTALALTGQQGGWPLTMFLTPDGAPFWGGTYFPPTPRYGRPGFGQVLEKIAEVYRNDPASVSQNRVHLGAALRRAFALQPGEIAPDVLEGAAAQALSLIDWRHGGLTGAPKFPQPVLFSFLWRQYKYRCDAKCRDAVLLTLERMSQGGIYDHLGGGYARYTVDDRWLVPHFEKMLYDNAQILSLLLDAWRETANPLFRQRIYETVNWLLGSMRSPDGAFAASFDADSEGEEGRYYVWDEREVDALLGTDAALFKAHYDVTPSGNWEGHTILNRLASAASTPQEEDRLAKARSRLLDARAGRVPPARDDKVLADWNGLTIASLAEAAAAFGEDIWLEAAESAFRFIQKEMARGERLSHSSCGGRKLESDMVEDYGAMGLAALPLFEVTSRQDYLDTAETWAATAKTYFEDPAGGFHQSPSDATDVFLRARNATDHAVPSGNTLMARLFAKLHHLTLKESHRAAAERTLNAFATTLREEPLSSTGLLSVFSDLLHAPQIVVIGEDQAPWRRALFNLSLPGRSLRFVDTPGALPEGHPLRETQARSGQTVAFLCRGEQCSRPLIRPADLPDALFPDHPESKG